MLNNFILSFILIFFFPFLETAQSQTYTKDDISKTYAMGALGVNETLLIQQKLMTSPYYPKYKAALDEALVDPEFKKAWEDKDFSALQKNPRYKKFYFNPDVQEIMNEGRKLKEQEREDLRQLSTIPNTNPLPSTGMMGAEQGAQIEVSMLRMAIHLTNDQVKAIQPILIKYAPKEMELQSIQDKNILKQKSDEVESQKMQELDKILDAGQQAEIKKYGRI